MADESTDPRIHGAKGKLFFEEVSPVSPADNANVAPVPYLKAGTKHVVDPDLEFFVEFFRYAALVKVIERFHVVSVELQYNLALHVLNSVSVSMTFSSHRTQLYK